MRQEDFFGESQRSRNLEGPDLEVRYVPSFLDPPRAQMVMERLLTETSFQQYERTLFGVTRPTPREEAWIGDPTCRYGYSGVVLQPSPWTPLLQELRDELSRSVDATFNSVLVNHYRTGSDSMGWHADDEASLGSSPVIASLSLGATRTLQLRHVALREFRHAIELHSGDLLVMGGRTQAHWQHQIPKTSRAVGPRLNLTFRAIRVT